MSSVAVCTLFEKDYHYGLAGLANSLVRNGFVGTVYAGFRGPMPEWASSAATVAVGSWGNARRLEVAAGTAIVFLPMQTQAHFTNVKPDFMLELFAHEELGIERLVYLDPDICLVASWQFISDWLSCGVALCEDVNSPLPRNHPRRIGWRRYFGEHGIGLEYRSDVYVNGGCCGVSRSDIRFLENWRRLSQLMSELIGGLGTAKIEGGAGFRQLGFANCFDSSDQDALNAAVEMTGGLEYSVLPGAAMGFVSGAAVLPHALGARKPWRKKFLREAVQALPPTAADKAYWGCIDAPIRPMGGSRMRVARLALLVASAVGRFYRRSA
jgi:hypothetical protein